MIRRRTWPWPASTPGPAPAPAAVLARERRAPGSIDPGDVMALIAAG